MIRGVLEPAAILLLVPWVGFAGTLALLGALMILVGGFVIASIGGVLVAAGYLLWTSARTRVR